MSGFAADSGHLDIVQYSCTRMDVSGAWSLPWRQGGHLDVIESFHLNECPWEVGVLEAAANAGHVEAVKYLYMTMDALGVIERGSAMNKGHYEVVMYLEDSKWGIPLIASFPIERSPTAPFPLRDTS